MASNPLLTNDRLLETPPVTLNCAPVLLTITPLIWPPEALTTPPALLPNPGAVFMTPAIWFTVPLLTKVPVQVPVFVNVPPALLVEVPTAVHVFEFVIAPWLAV